MLAFAAEGHVAARQVAIVTGAASGIGLEVAKGLASRGVAVVLADRNTEGAVNAAAAISGDNDGGVSYAVDVTDAGSVGALVTRTLQQFGRIDILVHSAGIGIECGFLDTSLKEWERIIHVDLTGTFLTSQAVARVMVARRYGRIVLLASTAGI